MNCDLLVASGGERCLYQKARINAVFLNKKRASRLRLN